MKEVTTLMPLIAPERVLPTDGPPTRVDERTWSVTAAEGPGSRIRFDVTAGPSVLLTVEAGERHVLPDDGSSPVDLTGSGACRLFPPHPGADEPAWHIVTDGANRLHSDGDRRTVTVHAGTATVVAHRARPHADVDGARFALDLPGGDAMADALAEFYWGTVLPCVVERTAAAGYHEYPCVYAWVLFTEYLGIRSTLTADPRIAPQVAGSGTVTLGQRAYALTYRIDQDGFELVNDARETRSFELDVSALGKTGAGTPGPAAPRTAVLGPGESIRIALPDTSVPAGQEARA
jgi:hypothetical protein